MEGTQTGVITDIDGNFSIDVPKGQGKLVISYIGYSPVTVALNGRTQINVTLFEESVNLQEVVVVGYNTVKRNQLTGSVDLVKSDKIKAPQILHGRNTLQKYVENRELPKSTQKVLKIKEC